jgi:hypothetical protein
MGQTTEEPVAPETSLEGVLEHVQGIVREHWGATREPLLLSLIAPELSSHGMDYKQLLGTVRLSEFLASNAEGRFVLVRHPTKRAKVGLIPAGEQFEYEPEPIPVTRTAIGVTSKRRSARYALLNFLDALGDLPPEELDKIVLPVSAMVKLLERR